LSTNPQPPTTFDLDWLDAIGVALLILLSVGSVAALLLAQVGWFSLSLWLVATIVPLSLVGIGFRRPLRAWVGQVHATPPRELLTVAALLLAGGILFARPAEFILGGADAGVYTNLGANTAKTGALLVDDTLTAGLPATAQPGFLRAQPAPQETDYLRFPGFYLSETQPGELIPQFYPLHPLWLAVGYALGGVSLELWLTPIWAVFGLWAIYLFARTVFTWQFAAVATLLVAVTPLQLYFSRYPTAEPMTQYFIWTGLWSFTHFVTYRRPRWLWGLGAGLALGQVFLVRIDALPMLILPAVWLLWLFVGWGWRRDEWSFWISYTALLAMTMFHGFWFSAPYTLNTYRAVGALALRGWPIFIVLLVLAIGAVIGMRRFLPRLLNHPARAVQIRRGRILLAVSLALLAIYAYFLRPLWGTGLIGEYWYGGGAVPDVNHENLVRLGWYLTPLGIGLATLGGMILLLWGDWRKLWPWLLVGGAFTFLYIYDILNNPFQIYAMRRYVPVVAPTLVIAAVSWLAWLWTRPRRQFVLRGAALILGGVWLAGMLANSRLIVGNVEYAGVTRQVATLAGQFPANAVLLFVDPAPVGLGVVVGTPLHFLHGLPAYDLQEEQLTAAVLAEQIAQWQRAGYAPYIIRTPDAALPLPEAMVRPAGAFQITFPQLEQSYSHPPGFVQSIDLAMEIYAVTPP
jgi:hypothetical protein